MNFIVEKEQLSEIALKPIVKKIPLHIASIVVCAANVANATPVDTSRFEVDIPISSEVMTAPLSDKMPDFNEWCLIGESANRTAMLNSSLKNHGYGEMDSTAASMWREISRLASEIPFSSVAAQYDRDSGSFFLMFGFASDRRIEATVYVDEEDDDVYFSVSTKGEVFLQNSIPMVDFFSKVASLWRNIDDGGRVS